MHVFAILLDNFDKLMMGKSLDIKLGQLEQPKTIFPDVVGILHTFRPHGTMSWTLYIAMGLLKMFIGSAQEGQYVFRQK